MFAPSFWKSLQRQIRSIWSVTKSYSLSQLSAQSASLHWISIQLTWGSCWFLHAQWFSGRPQLRFWNAHSLTRISVCTLALCVLSPGNTAGAAPAEVPTVRQCLLAGRAHHVIVYRSTPALRNWRSFLSPGTLLRDVVILIGVFIAGSNAHPTLNGLLQDDPKGMNY